MTSTYVVPVVPAGVVQVIDVEETTVTDVQALPPTVTVGPAKKPVPVMVIAVPPAVDPEVGEKEPTVGATKWVKPRTALAVPESLLVTTTSLAPADPGATPQRIWVEERKETLVQATPPTDAVIPAAKFVPVI